MECSRCHAAIERFVKRDHPREGVLYLCEDCAEKELAATSPHRRDECGCIPPG